MVKTRTGATSTLVARTALLAGLWWLIAQGRPDAWLVGLPAVALAAWATSHPGNDVPSKFSLTGLFVFAALFLSESIRGGIDVAARTLGPSVRIKPSFVRYRLNIHDPAARVLLINCIGLLPGTLASDLDGDYAEVHLLDSTNSPEPQLIRLEQAIANLFCITLSTRDA